MCRNGNSSSSAGPESCTIKHQTELVIGCERNVYKPIIPTAEVLTGCSGLLLPFPCVSVVSRCAGVQQALPCSLSPPSCFTDRKSCLAGDVEMFFIPCPSWGQPSSPGAVGVSGAGMALHRRCQCWGGRQGKQLGSGGCLCSVWDREGSVPPLI